MRGNWRDCDRLRAAGVPERFTGVIADRKVDLTRGAIPRAQAWRQGPKRLLVLGGGVGLGKTLAACWLISTGPRHPYPHPGGYDEPHWPSELQPRFIRAARLARLDTYRSGELGLVERCSLLVIDEVGGGDVGLVDSWAGRPDSIVSGRYDAGLDTVLTTNLLREAAKDKPPEFRELFGDRLFDRVAGTGGTWEEFAGASMRGGAR